MAVNPLVYAQAPADLCAISNRPMSEPVQVVRHSCCSDSSRAAFQQHQLRKELVCAASREANRPYLCEYGRTRRDEHRDEPNRRRHDANGPDKPRGPRT